MSDTGKSLARSSSKLALVVGFGAIAVLLGGFGTWAVNARIDGAVMAGGRITVDRNRQAVQHLEGGTVLEVLVKEGDTVAKDQLLIALDPQLSLSELTVVEGQLYEFMARRGRFEAERDAAAEIQFDPLILAEAEVNPEVQALMRGQQKLFEARRASVAQSKEQLHNQELQLGQQITGIDAQMTASGRQSELVAQETKAQASLFEKGLAANSRLLSLQREEARLAGLLGELTARRAQAQERIAEIKIQGIMLVTARQEEATSALRDIEMAELEMRERRRSLKTRISRMEIRAPVSGVVYDLKVFGAASVIRAADPLLYLVPQDRPLVIEAHIPPTNINEVHSKQLVVLRFPAFDQRSTPDLLGSVARISPDAFTEPQTGRSYYRAEIELPPTELEKLSADQLLLPGMPVDTFIRTGEHTPFHYLVEPLTRYFTTAMRDS